MGCCQGGGFHLSLVLLKAEGCVSQELDDNRISEHVVLPSASSAAEDLSNKEAEDLLQTLDPTQRSAPRFPQASRRWLDINVMEEPREIWTSEHKQQHHRWQDEAPAATFQTEQPWKNPESLVTPSTDEWRLVWVVTEAVAPGDGVAASSQTTGSQTVLSGVDRT